MPTFSMNVLVLTGFTDEFTPVGAITAPRWAVYANRHGYGFVCDRDYPPERGDPRFQRIRHILTYLPECDWLFCVDADALCTNMGIPLKRFMRRDISMSKDWPIRERKDRPLDGAGSTCAMLVRNCPLSMKLFEDALTLSDKWGKQRNYDQSAIWEVIESDERYRGMVNLMDRTTFAAVPRQFDRQYDRAKWTPGDFILHVTGQLLPKRVEILTNHLRFQ